MLHSMTGFARAAADTGSGSLTWELRAVNHRYLDVQFKMPDDLRPQEQALKKIVAARIGRGNVECSLNVSRDGGKGTDIVVDDELVRVLARRLEDVADVLGEASNIDPIDVLRWPGVIRQPEIDVDSLVASSSKLLRDAVQALEKMRASEGERITTMLEARLEDIEAISKSVRERMPEVLEAARTKQRERLAKLDVEADPDRLEAELALLAQKLDVDEELDRLDSHVTEIRDALDKDEPVGRRLDFLMQELNREANTLGSKSGDAETTRAAVDLKVLIEQMREQIQNVE